jgi:hypothetical protein
MQFDPIMLATRISLDWSGGGGEIAAVFLVLEEVAERGDTSWHLSTNVGAW